MESKQTAGPDPELETLIARCMAGDQAAFGEIYHRHANGLYRLAYSILLDEQDTEDVLQEAFVYAFRNLDRYDPQRGEFRTWLYTITVSRCRNMRRRKVLPMVDLSGLLAMGKQPAGPCQQTPEAVLARKDIKNALEAALAELSHRLREAVALRYGQGLTYREMAEVMGCPQKTAESRIRLAHEGLGRMLGPVSEALLGELWSF